MHMNTSYQIKELLLTFIEDVSFQAFFKHVYSKSLKIREKFNISVP